jgi:hypothetical protein
MKIKSLLMTALVVMSSAVAFAVKDAPVNTGLKIVPAKGSEVFKVIYRGESVGRIKLNVYTNSGLLIFTENIYGVDGFIFPLNFTGLSSGEYTVEVVDASGKKIEKISYHPKGNFKQVHISKISKADNKYIVAVANSGEQLIHINIYNDKNSLVYTESKTITGDFAQVYKLDNKSSSYTFQVSDKDGNTKTLTF